MVAKRRQRSHRSSYRLLMVHLLKAQFQRERLSRSWLTTIARERKNIDEREQRDRGLQMTPADIDAIYRGARAKAADETGLPLKTFLAECPYSLTFLRSHDALPE